MKIITSCSSTKYCYSQLECDRNTSVYLVLALTQRTVFLQSVQTSHLLVPPAADGFYPRLLAVNVTSC